jgi:hypothetical protein
MTNDMKYMNDNSYYDKWSRLIMLPGTCLFLILKIKHPLYHNEDNKNESPGIENFIDCCAYYIGEEIAYIQNQ